MKCRVKGFVWRMEQNGLEALLPQAPMSWRKLCSDCRKEAGVDEGIKDTRSLVFNDHADVSLRGSVGIRQFNIHVLG